MKRLDEIVLSLCLALVAWAPAEVSAAAGDPISSIASTRIAVTGVSVSGGADQGLAVISLSIDDLHKEKTVREFLARQGATFDNLASKFGSGTESAEVFDLRGGVPLYKLYDRQGKLRYQFGGDPEGLEGGKPIDQIDRRVEELLKEK